MSARTIKNPATISGKGVLSSQTVRLTNGVNYCALDSNSSGELLVNGVPVGGGGGGGVSSVTGGDGIIVTGTANVSVAINTSEYSTTTEANALYQPVGSYQTTSAMANYSTTTEANALYQPKLNYSIGYYKGSFTFGSIAIGSYSNFFFTIPNFTATANSIITLTSNTANTVPYAGVSYTVNYAGIIAPTSFICSVYNYSPIVLTDFPFIYSAIAINSIT